MMDTTITQVDEEEDTSAETTDKEKDNGEAMDTSEEAKEKRGKKVEAIPILEPLPEGEIEGHAFSFVNELKLSDFKLVLSKNNILSEFQGGVLFCGGGTVALRYQYQKQFRENNVGKTQNFFS
jgi:hypothetical protein